MSEIVCYIERAERGALPVRARLVSTRVDESWAFPEVVADDRAALQRGLAEAAAWVSERLRVHGRAGLGALVLDADGSLCAWVSTPSADADAIGAMLRQAGAPTAEEDAAHAMGSPPQLSLSGDVQTPGGASVQPLGVRGEAHAPRAGASGGPAARRRLGVLVVPDAAVRLLLDELDAQGVPVARVVTVWHALADAFDAGGRGARAERVVAEANATTAQLAVDHAGGRLLWAWSRAAEPIAAGAFRLVRTGAGEQAHASLGRADLARLASEWIAWSTQLGASPSRVRVLLPDDAWAGEESLGESVAAVWPGATADITFDADPIGAALARFADGLPDARVEAAPRPAVLTLQTRPGRQHRAMYRWAAGAIALAAIVMAVGAGVVHRSGSQAQAKADAARRDWRDQAGQLLPTVNEGPMAGRPFDTQALNDLRAELEARRQRLAPVQAAPEKPILAELQTLSYVLGNTDYELTRLDVSSNAVIIDVTVPDTAAYEELVESLTSIGGSAIGHWERSPRPAPQGRGIRAQLTGLWAAPSAGSGGAGGGTT